MLGGPEFGQQLIHASNGCSDGFLFLLFGGECFAACQGGISARQVVNTEKQAALLEVVIQPLIAQPQGLEVLLPGQGHFFFVGPDHVVKQDVDR